ncbi:HAD family hydrolase [Paenibacillus lycopersici]|uniref:HAD family hydrolase n=1 Tax=Paenibacillus lycopersici TaxID=2704462 RepID=A0A6C0FTG7_9BACL|nr:HAD-IA family hydrolase [Paenibacillus lycopersici]QHT60456.1 HAD family hydrolase [Paenibacillus lycopersici]
MAIRGVIFDMDNTLLRSSINFAAMKRETADYLLRHGAVDRDLPIGDFTTSSLVALAQRSVVWNARMKQEIEALLAKHEEAGMIGAELEPGVMELVSTLRGRQRLAVLTNNAYRAAKLALETNGIEAYFDCIVAREQMAFMKPAPDGVLVILRRYPELGPHEWLSVGDSWIDGQAAQEAGVAFVAYGGDVGRMQERGVYPAGCIGSIGELLSYL